MLTAAERAPEAAVTWLQGPGVALSELWRTSPVVLVFFKVACPTCQLTLPYLERIHRAKQGPRLLAISQDNASQTNVFHREFGISLPTLLDAAPDYPASNAFGISSVPSLFRIDRGGRIVWSEAGFDRARLTELGREAGIETFAADDRAPAFQPG